MYKALPSFSIIIPTYKRHKEVCLCLDSLATYFDSDPRPNHCISLEVIVSDDARDIQLSVLLEQRYPWCLYIEGPASGPAANRNHGALHASLDWLVFTDDDCLPQPGWIEAFALYSDAYDVMEGRTSPVGVRTRADEECPINETGGYLWSCNFAIKRLAFFELGGFNVDFPAAAMEDVELNLRVNQAGLMRIFVSNALVLHPWRLRKGRQYALAHSRSVGKFVSLHPQQAARFSLVVQLKKAALSLKHNVTRSVLTRQYKGLMRQIALDFISHFLTWRAVAKAR